MFSKQRVLQLLFLLSLSSCGHCTVCAGCFMAVPEGDDSRMEVLDFATGEVASKVRQAMGSDGQGCDVRIKKVHKFEQQVVAGMKYRMTFSVGCQSENSLSSTSSEGAELLCRELEVFQPLPYACKKGDGEQNPRCLSITGNVEEKCGAPGPGAQ